MKLPRELRRGDCPTEAWCNDIVRYLRSITPRESPQIRVHRGTGGSTFNIKRAASSALPSSTADELNGEIEVATERDYVLIQSASVSRTVTTLTIKAVTGTCTVDVKINGTSIIGLATLGVSDTEASWTATGGTGDNILAIGDTLTLVVSSNSEAVGVAFTLILV